MDEKLSRRDSLNFRDFFTRRRNSLDEAFSVENSRKNSLVNPESFKNLVSLMVVSKVTASHVDP
jgi:hypothetical protein